MQVIGVCGGDWGGEKVGKTLACKIICDRLGFTKADCMLPVLEFARRLANWDGELNDDGRRVINAVCSSGRCICESYWLNLAVGSLKKEDARGVVIDNVFFRNEHQYVLDSGGILIRLESIPGQVFESDSERIGMPVTTVVNNGSVEALTENLIRAVAVAANLRPNA